MDERVKSIVTIICAKKESKRFPKKNKRLIENVFCGLTNSPWPYLKDIVVATDDNEIVDVCRLATQVLHRPKNASVNDESVFNIARWAYYSLNQSYDHVCVVLPNVIKFSVNTINFGLQTLMKNNLNEVRSYDKNGVENGVIIMKTDWFLHGSLSTYCGAIISDAKEIHREEELLL